MFKERVKRTILGVSGHGYAVLAVDEAGVMRGASLGYGWRQAKSRDEVRTGFSTKAVRLFVALGRDRIHVKVVERTNSETFVEFLKELRQEYGRLIILLDNASYHRYRAVNEFVKSACGEIKAGLPPAIRPATQPNRDPVEGTQGNACGKVLRIDRRSCRCNSRPDRFGLDEASQADEIPRLLNDESNPHGNTCP